MGQFKPMVKMETTEPSVILKLKKGGHVASAYKDENGHTNMKGAAFKAKQSEESCEAEAPKKPSMADRRKAMSGSLLNSKKGGKVDKKANGGMMGTPAMAAPAVVDPSRAAALRAMVARRGAPAVRMAAPAAVRGGLPAMKKGGEASDTAQDKALIAKAMKQHDMQEHKGGKGTKLKLATGGLTNPMKTGGTVEGNAGAFANTKMERKKTTPGYERYATGGVVNGMATGGLTNPMKKGGKVNTSKADPGYERYATGGLTNPMKKGGAAKKHFATGGSVNDTGRAVAMPKRPVSQPVSNTRQSGTFKKGGKVESDLVDASKGAYDRSIGPSEEDMRMAKAFRDPIGSMKKLLGFGPDQTEKQMIHAGGYKKGGNAKR